MLVASLRDKTPSPANQFNPDGGDLGGGLQPFTSGATSSKHLPMYDCIPEVFLRRTAIRFTLGAKKHGKFNYKCGLSDKQFMLDRLNHAFVHLKAAIDAIQGDERTEDDNLGAVAVNISMVMEYEQANGLEPKY